MEDISFSQSREWDSDENESLQQPGRRSQTQRLIGKCDKNPKYDEFHHMSILIANQDYYKILDIEQILNQFSIYDIAKADNGLIAYEKALSHKFDLILLELTMPIMSGIEAGKKIHEHYTRRLIMLNEDERHSYGVSSGSSMRMPLIYGLTNWVDVQMITEAKRAGFTDIVVAPFNY